MTKKEFKKKCKAEKTTSYKLSFSGAIVALIGAIIVATMLFFVKGFSTQIVGYIVGATIALIGAGLDLAGEIQLSQNYKEYIRNEKMK